jgi:hypothetical protein
MAAGEIHATGHQHQRRPAPDSRPCRLLRFTYNQSTYNQSPPATARHVAGRLQLTEQESAVSRSFPFFLAGFVCASLAGCSDAPGPVEKVAKSTAAASATSESAPPQYEPPMDDGKMEDDNDDRVASETEPAKDNGLSKSADEAGPHELSLDQSGISFTVPAGWKQVKPPNRIVEAEFELPRVEGDEYDGRLTLMSATGDPQQVIAIRTAEFRQEPAEPAITETLKLGDIESQLIDLRGEWRDSIRASKPRADYRMLLLIVPFSKGSAFYAKLTGPRSTVAAHEVEFREFLRSARITR